ncbi:hypothetical protein M3599_15405 [Niallia circulans]|nr:hypothetical protein [Niallia circulans]MCM2982312.1 hypothetical protein [Niallia circulans]
MAPLSVDLCSSTWVIWSYFNAAILTALCAILTIKMNNHRAAAEDMD